jgi:Uma2 family endonuclease
MSAVPRQPSEGYAGLRMSAEEYLALGETFERYELVDGVVIMSPRPTRAHQLVLRLIMRQLEAFLDELSPESSQFDYYPDVDIRFGPRCVYAPDLCCYLPGRAPPLTATLDIAPDLIIEILSPGNKTHDLIRKRADYGRFGVREYWIIDPADGGVRSFRLRDAELIEFPVAGDSVASEAIPGLALDLRPLRKLASEE